MSRRALHFSLGPVQGFVAQARRTRDLWGGSFLLSWLSGVAMKAVIDAGGRIVYPSVQEVDGTVTDELLSLVLGNGSCLGAAVSIGSLPNRFKAEMPENFDGAAEIATRVRALFEDASTLVWNRYLSAAASDGRSKAIWDRQVRNFWEITWVLGDDPGDGSDVGWLDARKHWRLPVSPEPEGGDHCTVMHNWQELSGLIRAEDRVRQDDFWKAVRRQVGDLDLRSDERLCAIAFVKRMLPKLAGTDEGSLGWRPDVRGWPSTAYMAAVPWIKAAWEEAPEASTELAKLARRYFKEGAFGERETKIAALTNVDKAFRGLDGNAFHFSALQNIKTTPLKQEGGRDELANALTTLQARVGRAASPFYALLLMDGDSLGKLLRSTNSGSDISQALADFTNSVQTTVSSNSGVTIYAGGDDVLAMLPVNNAIDAALQLEQIYSKAFRNRGIEDASISGAIVFSHFKQPLQAVLKEAHHALADVAKADNGRSSLALSVLQGAGKNVEWVSTWHAESKSPPRRVEKLASQYRSDRQFSSRFFHGLGNFFGLLSAHDLPPNNKSALDLEESQMERWMIAEYLDNRELETTAQQAQETVKSLLTVCRRHRRVPREFELQPSGARLVKFLAFPGEDT